MENFTEAMYNICSALQPFVIALVCISFLVIGIMLIYPSQKSKEKGKEAIPWVAIGCAVALGAVSLGKWLGGIAAF